MIIIIIFVSVEKYIPKQFDYDLYDGHKYCL